MVTTPSARAAPIRSTVIAALQNHSTGALLGKPEVATVFTIAAASRTTATAPVIHADERSAGCFGLGANCGGGGGVDVIRS